MNKSRVNRFFINALNIHKGGGLVLLNDILNEIPEDVDSIVLVDARVHHDLKSRKNISYKYIKPTIFCRLFAELWLFKRVNSEDSLLSFGNLPPLFKLPSKTTLFLQNRYLVDMVSLKNFGFKARLRIFFERLWFHLFLRNVTEVIVQTSSMKRFVENKTGISVRILPFRKKITKTSDYRLNNKLYDFIYVANSEPHKNHSVLIDAWHLLAQDKIFPSLLLTLTEADFYFLSKSIKKNDHLYNLDITNIGHLNRAQLAEAYKKTSTLIYPSTFESFGLPLLEAKDFGLSVIASELDFVRDLIAPDQTFNPLSPLSIARAVKRHLGVIDDIQSVEHPSAFVSHILKII